MSSTQDAEPTVVVQSPAKLNLYLELIGKRADGYHDLDTVMMAIDWCDRLRIRRVNGSGIRLACQWDVSRESMAAKMGVNVDDAILDLPNDQSNLVHRALAMFQAAFQVDGGFDVVLEKRIPAGAGMGGASSNAASALLAAASLCDVPLANPELNQIAASIGSDVPFFMGGAASQVGTTTEISAKIPHLPYIAARATGTGTSLHPLYPTFRPHAVVVFPGVSLSTAMVYKHCTVAEKPDPADDFIEAWLSDQPDRIGKHLRNRLSEPAKKLAPRIEQALESMRRTVGPACQLTGSGSACFGLTSSREEAESFAEQLRDQLGMLVQAVSACTVPAL